MADKKNKGLQGDLLTCPRCKGRGKIVCQRDEEDLYGHEQTCPVCGGRGKIKPTGRPFKRPRRSRYSSIPSQPKSGGGGRRRPPRSLLLPPGTPMAPWPQGDGIPPSTPESLHRRPREPELAIPETPDTPPTCTETPLDVDDDLTITLGLGFGPDFALDVEALGSKDQQLLESDDGRISTQVDFPQDGEALLAGGCERDPLTNDLTFVDVDDGRDDPTVRGVESVPPAHSADPSMEAGNLSIAGWASQSVAGGGLDIPKGVDTDVIGAHDPLDPPIDYDPIGFDIDADGIGPEPW